MHVAGFGSPALPYHPCTTMAAEGLASQKVFHLCFILGRRTLYGSKLSLNLVKKLIGDQADLFILIGHVPIRENADVLFVFQHRLQACLCERAAGIGANAAAVQITFLETPAAYFSKISFTIGALSSRGSSFFSRTWYPKGTVPPVQLCFSILSRWPRFTFSERFAE